MTPCVMQTAGVPGEQPLFLKNRKPDQKYSPVRQRPNSACSPAWQGPRVRRELRVRSGTQAAHTWKASWPVPASALRESRPLLSNPLPDWPYRSPSPRTKDAVQAARTTGLTPRYRPAIRSADRISYPRPRPPHRSEHLPEIMIRIPSGQRKIRHSSPIRFCPRAIRRHPDDRVLCPGKMIKDFVDHTPLFGS